MDYNIIYDRLIYTRLILKEERKILKSSGYYFEKHHIIPKCKGGNNETHNIVYLTSREHFLAHWLLWLIYRDRQMALGFHKMISKTKYMKRSFSARDYEKAREAYRITNIGNSYSKGRTSKVSEEQKHAQSMAMKGRYDGDKNPFFGKNHLPETISKMKEIAIKRFTNSINPRSIPILDLETGIFYYNTKDAAETYNINQVYLRCMLNGKNKNKTNLIRCN